MRPDVAVNLTIAVHLAMLGWFPLCVLLFTLLKPWRAVPVALVTGILLLPNASYNLPGLPDYDKTMAVGCGIAFAAVILDLNRVLRFKFQLIDLPMLCLLLAPLFSSTSMGAAPWTGMSGSVGYVIRWGVPWFLGRIYLTDPRTQRYFLYCIVMGGLIYVPFCLLESKFSPQMHELVYGIKLKSFKHANRGTLWRPNVFMEHGLKCALFMAFSTMMAFWMWKARLLRAVWGTPMALVTVVLAVTTVLASSSNALLMGLSGSTALWLGLKKRMAWPLIALICVPPTYITVREVIGWEGTELTELAAKVFGKDRAISLRVRLDNENKMRDEVFERPWFGYQELRRFTGNTGTKQVAIVDSMWLLYLGLHGFYGLTALFMMLLIGPYMVWKHLPPGLWGHPAIAPAVAIAFMVLLFSIDSLLNAFQNPIFTAAAGGVSFMAGTRQGRSSLMRELQQG